MSWCQSKGNRRWLGMLLSILLLCSTLLAPGMGVIGYGAAQEEQLAYTDELALEQQREKEAAGLKDDTTGEYELEKEYDLSYILEALGLEEPGDAAEHFLLDGKLEQGVQQAFENHQEVNVIIRLKEQADLEQAFHISRAKGNRVEQIKTIQSQLQQVAERAQRPVLAELQNLEQKQLAMNIRPFWIFNGMAATVTQDALEQLLEREDVERITLDKVFTLPELQIEAAPPQLPEWGLEKIFATRVWGEYGLKGEGIVVGIMDSGVDGGHEALRHNYRGRDGNHQYSWIDLSGNNYATPSDGHGHGTHVAGTAVGGGAGKPIGVAPEAEWIAAKIFQDNGSTTSSAIHAAFEWFLAPGGDPAKAPHLVNNSWGSAATYRTEFWDGVQAWVAAGIFPLFAAGNNGPGAGTVGSPASFPSSFSVGATDINDQIAYFSSRGPVHWVNEDGENIRYIKPEVSAPGHQIYSAWPEVRNQGKYMTISGTSMATPHVAGAIALILQAKPELSIDEIADLLQRTARAEAGMGELPNDHYGYGIVDVYRAVTEAVFAGEIRGQLTDDQGQPIAGTIKVPEQNITLQVPESGQFQFMLREGSHQVLIESFGYLVLNETVQIERGEIKQVNWRMAPAERYTISGRVTLAVDGSPVAYAYLRVPHTPLSTIRSDKDGHFTISNLPVGSYQLSIAGEGIQHKQEAFQVNGSLQLDISVNASQRAVNPDWSTANNNAHRNAVSASALDSASLKKGWYYQAPGQINWSTPAVGEGKVVFTTTNGWVIALDEETGTEAWRVKTGNGNSSSPTIVQGTVYAGGGIDQYIYALDLHSGNTKWSYHVGQDALYESPLYHEGVIYATSGVQNDAYITALDAETGRMLWRKPIGNNVIFGGAIGGGALYVGAYASRNLSALNLQNGEELWRITVPNEGFVARPVYSDGVLFAISANNAQGTGTLWALEAQSGEELWRVAGIGDTLSGSAIVFDDFVLVGSATNSGVRAFDRTTGQERWSNAEIGSMYQNGSVTANGLLIVADRLGRLAILDVYTGEKLKELQLDQLSNAGIAITPGKAIVADTRGVRAYVAPGVLTGAITDASGTPVQGKVTVVETGVAATASEDGSYTLEASPGQYTIKVQSYGLKQVYQEALFISGYVQHQSFSLEEAAAGSLSGTILDQRTGEPVENVELQLLDTPLTTFTDEQGRFSLPTVYEGIYELQAALGGYLTLKQTIDIVAGEELTLALQLAPIDIAVLNDWEGELTRFLMANGFAVEERGWDVIDDLERYRLLYLNGAYTTGGWRPDNEQVIQLVDQARAAGVSIVFADTWGISYGTVRHLHDAYQDPQAIGSDYRSATVYLRADQAHPIFEGLPIGQRLDLQANGEFSWFNQYSGRHLGSIGSTIHGYVGSGVAHKAVSEESAHLLLSNHAASPWVSPYNGWLQPQQHILINGINFLLDSKYGHLSGEVVDGSGQPILATIEVLETGVVIQNDEATGAFNLYHDQGTYTLLIRAHGYGSHTQEISFTYGEPVELNVQLGESSSGLIGQVFNQLTNQVIADAQVEVINDQGVIVAETRTSANGRFELEEIAEATYTITISKAEHVTYRKQLEITASTPEQTIYLYPAPRVAILGDYANASLNLRYLLSEVGITAENFTNIVQLTDRIGEFDVVFYNDHSVTTGNRASFLALLEAADQHEVSIIFGDTNTAGAGLAQLASHRGDPGARTTVTDTTRYVEYVVLEEHPLFGEADAGDLLTILEPSGGRVAYFNDYSGYPLAEIMHQGREQSHGLGIAFMPRTGNSLELLMGGHGSSLWHHNNHYTEAGKQLFIDAILWSAYAQFGTIHGHVLDTSGQPILAEIVVLESGFSTWTDPETGMFSLAHVDGSYTVQVSAYGYETLHIDVEVSLEMLPLELTLAVDHQVGRILGNVTNERDGDAIADAHIALVGHPREAVTALNGDYVIDRLLPGTYELIVQRDGYLLQEHTVTVHAGLDTTLNIQLKPSLTVGIIGDAFLSSQTPLRTYLSGRGYNVEELYYTDTDRLASLDLVFVNAVYDSNRVPTTEQILNFMKWIDKTETSVIWTGQHGSQGSIRFLQRDLNDPAIIYGGSTPAADRVMRASILDNQHPLVAGVEPEFTFTGRYYYGFDQYNGTPLVELAHNSLGDLGNMIAYRGRTLNSVEVLLATMTISNEFHMHHAEFDKNRERILNNAILWAIENREPLVGELHGQVVNNLGFATPATITVLETGYTQQTEADGSFYVGLDQGTYTLQIETFGHATQSFIVSFERGVRQTTTFELTAEQSGTLQGQVRGVDSGNGIAQAHIQLVGTPLSTVTDSAGNYALVAPVGEYQVRITAPGYRPYVQTVVIGDQEDVTLNVTLSIAEKIAVLATSLNIDRLLPFLQAQGYDADGWLNTSFEQLMDEMDQYSLIIFNDRHTSTMNQARFQAFLERADDTGTSIIFSSQFSGGTINDLRTQTGDPQNVSWSFAPERIEYVVSEAHPIFRGFEVGEEITILDAENPSSSQQYAIYGNYSGSTIGHVRHHDRGVLGEGVGYTFRTAQNVHVLLSSLQVGTYGHPNHRWTDAAKQIYLNAIDWALNASLGEIRGTVTDEEGEPIAGASVTISASGLSTATNSAGEYRLGVGLGTYEVQVTAKGYHEQTELVEVEELGQAVELNFVLRAMDRMNLYGNVIDAETGTAVEGAILTLMATDQEQNSFMETVITDAEGYYLFEEVLAGDYSLTVEAAGYLSLIYPLTIEAGEHLEFNISLGTFGVAVLGDHNQQLTNLLNEAGIATESRGWDILNDLSRYTLVIVNTNKGTDEQIEQLLAESDRHHVSLIFLDTWGVADGSIQLLERVQGYPQMDRHGYDQGSIYLQPLKAHPIFAGLTNGEALQIHSEQSPYASFSNYPGITLAHVQVDGIDQGTSMAYAFRSHEHLHLLLSTYAVTNIIGPEHGWTEVGKQLFVQAVEWAQSARQASPGEPVWDEHRLIVTESTVTVTGRLFGREQEDVEIDILLNQELVATVRPLQGGSFSADVTLRQGNNTLHAVARNFAGTEQTLEAFQIIYTPTQALPGNPGRPIQPPKKSHIEVIEISHAAVTLKWQGKAGESYEIYRGEELLVKTDQHTFTDDTVIPQQTYIYTIYVIGKNGKKELLDWIEVAIGDGQNNGDEQKNANELNEEMELIAEPVGS